MMVLLAITCFFSFVAGWAFANVLEIWLENYRRHYDGK